jgi:hypothetical protein
MKAAAEAEVQQLQSSLESTNQLLHKAMEAARTAEAEANTAAAAAQQELDGMRAKLAEAAGVLNAKEELREARYASNSCRTMTCMDSVKALATMMYSSMILAAVCL